MTLRFILALTVTVCAFTPAQSQTFMAIITKIDGKKVTYQKATFHRVTLENPNARYSYSAPESAELATDVVITRAHYAKGTGASTSEGHITGKTTPLSDGMQNPILKRSAEEMKEFPFPFLMTISENGGNKGKIKSINVWRAGPRG